MDRTGKRVFFFFFLFGSPTRASSNILKSNSSMFGPDDDDDANDNENMNPNLMYTPQKSRGISTPPTGLRGIRGLRGGTKRKHKNKSKARLTVELICEMWIYGVFIYIVRNLVGLIPFPLDGYQGFEHKRLKELTNPAVFMFTYIFFSDYLKTKLTYFYNKVVWE